MFICFQRPASCSQRGSTALQRKRHSVYPSPLLLFPLQKMTATHTKTLALTTKTATTVKSVWKRANQTDRREVRRTDGRKDCIVIHKEWCSRTLWCGFNWCRAQVCHPGPPGSARWQTKAGDGRALLLFVPTQASLPALKPYNCGRLPGHSRCPHGEH